MKNTDLKKSTEIDNRIRSLDTSVANQIAAGEVVERPAHLIKELVENSIDALATQIHIQFSDSGRFVQVTDNGRGIHPDDLPMALERHATSKISKTADLFALSSFGFRGEALASIAAVSRLTLSSKQANKKQGARIQSDFGKRSPVDGIGHAQGSSVRVEELFGNVPARLKFLKSSASESAQIKTVVKALALSHYNIEFQLNSDSETLFFYPAAASKIERARQVLEIENLYQGTAERDGVHAEVIYADPNTTAKTSKNIWLFAQDRWIQDRGLQAAVMEAYRNLLMHGEYPYVCAWVSLDPQSIDVNIHPTKSQVKFLNPSNAFRAVQAALRDSLEQAPWVQKFAQSQAGAKTRASVIDMEELRFSAPEIERTQYLKKELPSALEAKGTHLAPMGQAEFHSAPASAGQPVLNRKTGSEKDETKETFWSSLQVLGQAHLTYLICQSRHGLMLVDQHAAHERVLFEKLMSSWRGGKIDIQDYLFPIVIDLSAEKIEALVSQTESFQKLGLELEQMGPQSMGIKAAPLIVKESSLGPILDKVATEWIDQGGSFSFERMIGDLCASMACHSAIRAGQALSYSEMQALLVQMDEFALSSFCPHGRPVYIDYPLAQIEKDFGRTV